MQARGVGVRRGVKRSASTRPVRPSREDLREPVQLDYQSDDNEAPTRSATPLLDRGPGTSAVRATTVSCTVGPRAAARLRPQRLPAAPSTYCT